MRGFAAALAVLCTSFLLIPVLASAQQRASLPDIEDEVMCTICGTLLAESQSPQADRERALIRRLIDQGKTKDQIKNELVAEYGRDVLATPASSGFALSAWIVPIAGFVLAVGVIGAAVLRGRRRPAPAEPDEIPGPDAARLERDMSSYDL